MADVQLASDIGRRDDQREAGLLQSLLILARLKVATLDPLVLEAGLDLLRVVILIHIDLHDDPSVTVRGR